MEPSNNGDFRSQEERNKLNRLLANIHPIREQVDRPHWLWNVTGGIRDEIAEIIWRIGVPKRYRLSVVNCKKFYFNME